MSEEIKYYFTFHEKFEHPRTGVNMHFYWVELQGADTKAEARDAMCKLYGGGFQQHDSRKYKPDPTVYKNGCYETIYLPLPDDIIIETNDPLLNPKKKKSKGEERRMAEAKRMAEEKRKAKMFAAHSHTGSLNGTDACAICGQTQFKKYLKWDVSKKYFMCNRCLRMKSQK